MLLIMLHLYVANLWRVFSKCSFSDIPHTFIPHFTLHSAEKIRIEFSANYPLTTLRIPQNTPSRYLRPGKGDIPAFTPAEAGTRFSDPGGMQG